MIDYLVRSGLCLSVLLIIYHTLFEKQKMHVFNRYYLLISIFFGLIIPSVSVFESNNPSETSSIAILKDNILTSANWSIGSLKNSAQPSSSENGNYIKFILLIYMIVAALLFLRLFYNLLKIRSKIARSSTIRTNFGKIVLLDEKVIPHSFLGYTFLTKKDYHGGLVNPEILKHEFTHVTQLHSLDLLFIEILRVLFWFNPVFFFYKKAIQLNHEFLADENVIKGNTDISGYQSLLVETSSLNGIYLASNFNYSITKKRLKMMTKQTSSTRKMIMGLLLIPVAALLTLIFSNNANAQTPSIAIQKTTGNPK